MLNLTDILSALLGAGARGTYAIRSRYRDRREAAKGASSKKPDDAESFVIGREVLDRPDGSGSPVLGADVRIRFDELSRHLYSIGASGGGKTSAMLTIFDALVASGKTVLVFDGVGDLKRRLLKRLAKRGGPAAWRRRLFVIEIAGRLSVPLNFFALPFSPYTIVEMLMVSIEESSPSPLGVTVSEGLRFSMLALACWKGRYGLGHVNLMLSSPAFAMHVLTKCADPIVQDFWDRYLSPSTSQSQRATLQSAVSNKTSAWLAQPTFRRAVSQRTCIPCRKIVDTPGAIVILDMGILEQVGAASVLETMLFSAFVTAVLSRASDTDEGEVGRNRSYFLCDEAHRYISSQIRPLCSESRRFGGSALIFHQVTTQLAPAISDVVMGNSQTLLAFGCASRDASRIAGEIGGERGFAAREHLQKAKPGFAYMLARGNEAKRIKVSYTPDPDVDPALVSAIYEQALAEFGRPVEEVDREIADDFAEIASMRDSGPEEADAPRTSSEVEVRPLPRRSKPKKGEKCE